MRLIICIILMHCSLIASAQIDIRYNAPRVGDEIIKQQVEYKDPGRSGENVIWDFGKLQSVNDQYKLVYTEPRLIDKSVYIMGKDTIQSKDVDSGNLLIGTEHNTMYYYRIKEGQMLALGHENPTTLLQYTSPMLTGVYPTNYQDIHKDSYRSKGMYSSRIPFQTQGETEIQADAYGMLVLPDGDTLRHVIRIKTTQTIHETIKKRSGEVAELNTTLQSYKWYAKGYRYPVFETVKTINDRSDKKSFETAFFFPPQDHFYLDNDPGNLAILDSLWNIQHKIPEDINQVKQPQSNLLIYNFYPNPVETQLTIEYYLEQPTPVTITIYGLDGRQVQALSKQNQQQGLYSEQLDCSNLSAGTYILKIQTNSTNITDKIIKK